MATAFRVTPMYVPRGLVLHIRKPEALDEEFPSWREHSVSHMNRACPRRPWLESTGVNQQAVKDACSQCEAFYQLLKRETTEILGTYEAPLVGQSGPSLGSLNVIQA